MAHRVSNELPGEEPESPDVEVTLDDPLDDDEDDVMTR